jgi:hypothetical protein
VPPFQARPAPARFVPDMPIGRPPWAHVAAIGLKIEAPSAAWWVPQGPLKLPPA